MARSSRRVRSVNTRLVLLRSMCVQLPATHRISLHLSAPISSRTRMSEAAFRSTRVVAVFRQQCLRWCRVVESSRCSSSSACDGVVGLWSRKSWLHQCAGRLAQLSNHLATAAASAKVPYLQAIPGAHRNQGRAAGLYDDRLGLVLGLGRAAGLYDDRVR